MQMPFYIPLIITSCSAVHINAHITMQNFGDIMLFWWETHAHAFKHVSSNPLLRSVHLCDHTQTISMGFEILTLGVHSPSGTLAQPPVKLTRITIY